MSWLTATYLVACDERDIESRAAAIASEQSVECPLEANLGDQHKHEQPCQSGHNL